VRIDDRYASGVHARIFARDGRTWIEDMNSTNGTLLNDARLKGEAELVNGDLVRIGDTEFRYEAHA
jgi:pSer/pThr/pTyr-binding forkhead associated (FHA) protein